MCTGGRKGFLRAAFKKMKDSMKVDKGDEGDDRRAGSGPGPAFEAALVSAFGKKDKEDVAQVDMEQDLKELKLFDFFPASQWPPHAPVCLSRCLLFDAASCLLLCIQVRELKTKVEKVKKMGEPVPFVMVDLKKYAPLLFV